MHLGFKPDSVASTVTNETSYNCQRDEGASFLLEIACKYLDLILFAGNYAYRTSYCVCNFRRFTIDSTGNYAY